VIAVIGTSCQQEQSPSGVPEAPDELFPEIQLSRTSLRSPGELHNEILEALIDRGALAVERSGPPQPPEDFVRTFTRAVNDVLAPLGPSRRITEHDVRALAWVVEEYERYGLYDFSDPTGSDASAFISYMADNGVLERHEAARLISAVEELPAADVPLTAARASVTPAEPSASFAVTLGVDILRHSSIFWARPEELGLTDRGTSREDHNWANPVTGTLLADMVGGLVGLEFGGVGAIVLSAMSSIWFYNELEALEGGPPDYSWCGPPHICDYAVPN
jgi:hypothetical protein